MLSPHCLSVRDRRRALLLVISFSFFALLTVSGPASADVESGALPGGTSITVSINSPADGASLPPGTVPVAGTASVGAAQALPVVDMMVVLDRSGSISSGE